MDFKAILFLVASFLLVSTVVSSTDEELNMEAIIFKGPVPVPAQIPVKAPLPTIAPPPAKAPVIALPPPAKPPVIVPSPPQVPVKAPPPAPVVVKPPTVAPRPPIRANADCIPQCGQRCDLHSRKRTCMRACVTCCGRCKCVPPGTYGNREMCGTCYTGMTTHGNRFKCP